MARRRHVTRPAIRAAVRAGIAAATLAVAALAGAGAPAAAAECERRIILEYDIRGGGYQIELNGVWLDSGGGQFVSGGLPLTDWLLPGENVATVAYEAEEARFGLYSICGDGSGRVEYDEATVTGHGAEDLVFAVRDAPRRLYSNAAPVTEEGLLDAVAALRAAMEARDFDAVWALHAALRVEKAAAGEKMKAFEYRMRKIVETANPVFAPGLDARPVLGGRVWEVYGEDFAPPVADPAVAMNGGTAPFRTGSFWMKRDGVWSVYRQ